VNKNNIFYHAHYLIKLIWIITICFLQGCLATSQKITTGDTIPLDSVEELMQITTTPGNETDPEISPDGKHIAFVSDKAGSENIFISDLFGRNPRQLTFRAGHNLNPAWTPDGKSIIFNSDRLGYNAVFKIDLNRERITEVLVARGANDFAPDMAKSKSFIVFGNQTIYAESLWMYHLSRKQTSQIGEGIYPVISPNDRMIAYTSSKGGNSDLWLTDLKSQEIRQLTVDSAEDLAPSWSPDGNKIVFASNRGGNYDIWLFNMKRNQLIQLTNNPAEDGHPVWTPDGRYIYFHSKRSGNFDIWRIKPVRSK